MSTPIGFPAAAPGALVLAAGEIVDVKTFIGVLGAGVVTAVSLAYVRIRRLPSEIEDQQQRTATNVLEAVSQTQVQLEAWQTERIEDMRSEMRERRDAERRAIADAATARAEREQALADLARERAVRLTAESDQSEVRHDLQNDLTAERLHRQNEQHQAEKAQTELNARIRELERQLAAAMAKSGHLERRGLDTELPDPDGAAGA